MSGDSRKQAGNCADPMRPHARHGCLAYIDVASDRCGCGASAVFRPKPASAPSHGHVVQARSHRGGLSSSLLPRARACGVIGKARRLLDQFTHREPGVLQAATAFPRDTAASRSASGSAKEGRSPTLRSVEAGEDTDGPVPELEHSPLELRDHPGHLIRRLQQAHKVLWYDTVEADLTSSQFAVLNVLQQYPHIDQKTLGDRVGMDRSTIAGIVTRLVRNGLVVKLRDFEDHRRNVLRLSPRGRELLSDTLPAAAKVSEQLIAELDERDRQELLRILNILVRAHHPVDP